MRSELSRRFTSPRSTSRFSTRSALTRALCGFPPPHTQVATCVALSHPTRPMACSTCLSLSIAFSWFAVSIVVPPLSIGTAYRYNDENPLTCHSGSRSCVAGRPARTRRCRSVPVYGAPARATDFVGGSAGGPHASRPPTMSPSPEPWGPPPSGRARLRPIPATSAPWGASVQGRPPPILSLGLEDVFAGRSTPPSGLRHSPPLVSATAQGYSWHSTLPLTPLGDHHGF